MSGHRAAYEDRLHVLGGDYPDTLISLGDLARVHLAMERVDVALEECTKTLNARTLVLGPDHHDTLNSRNDLARIKMAMGCWVRPRRGTRPRSPFGRRCSALLTRRP